jgi:hypothetical protein
VIKEVQEKDRVMSEDRTGRQDKLLQMMITFENGKENWFLSCKVNDAGVTWQDGKSVHSCFSGESNPVHAEPKTKCSKGDNRFNYLCYFRKFS